MNLVKLRERLVIKRRHQAAAHKALLRKQKEKEDKLREIEGLLDVMLDSKRFPRRTFFFDPWEKTITILVWHRTWDRTKVDRRKVPKRFLSYKLKLEKSYSHVDMF